MGIFQTCHQAGDCFMTYCLRKRQKWHWGMKQKLTFTETKQILTSTEILVYFNPNKELILTCDAILHGIVAVLSHRMD